jgi:hypothetical protein
MFYVFLGAYIVFVLLPCYIAGSSVISRANEQIDQADDGGIEHPNPTA